MSIRNATPEDKTAALEIAKQLPEWFSKEGLKNIQTDFEFNHVIIAFEKEVVGFLCYTSYCGTMQLIWMGIHPDYQRKGIGSSLLKWLEDEAKKSNLKSIQVETLPDEDPYEPYKRTRDFYYQNDFKRILYKKATIEGWDDQIILEKIL